jgi:hypothetical protein
VDLHKTRLQPYKDFIEEAANDIDALQHDEADPRSGRSLRQAEQDAHCLQSRLSIMPKTLPEKS